MKSIASRPIILAGPPGCGKSTLGSAACESLGLQFQDSARRGSIPLDAERDQFTKRISERFADVIALSWALAQDPAIRKLARMSGTLLLLWAHPLDMQVRSESEEPLFTPVGRLKTRGGFGQNGTSCREFRRLDRGSDATLLLVGLLFDEATEAVAKAIRDLREDSSEPPTVRAGIDHWTEHWQVDFGVPRRATDAIVDAMARFLIHLRDLGVSPRSLSGITHDLNAAGMLIMMYEPPVQRWRKNVLESFSEPPYEFEYAKNFSETTYARNRYRRSLKRFAEFLRDSGLISVEN